MRLLVAQKWDWMQRRVLDLGLRLKLVLLLELVLGLMSGP